MNQCSMCSRPAVSKGLCTTHYRSEKVRQRETALRDIIEKTEKIKARRPEMTDVLDDLTKDARMLFRDFSKRPNPQDEIKELRAEIAAVRATPRKATPADEVRKLRQELAELKASLKKSR